MSVNEDKRSTLEYVRNALKNSRLKTSVRAMPMSTSFPIVSISEAEKRSRKDRTTETRVMSVSNSRITQEGKTLDWKILRRKFRNSRVIN